MFRSEITNFENETCTKKKGTKREREKFKRFNIKDGKKVVPFSGTTNGLYRKLTGNGL